MMMSDKKKPTTLIIAKMRSGMRDKMEDAPKNEVGDTEDNSLARESAAEELMNAIHSKDPKAIAAAFSSMMEVCNGYAEDEVAEEAKESEQESE